MASNVARLYLQFSRDLNDGTRTAPDFDYAVSRHELVERIQCATRATESSHFDDVRQSLNHELRENYEKSE